MLKTNMEVTNMSNLSFDGIGAVVATFAADEGVKGGQVVKMTGNGQVGPCSDNDKFCGVALEPRAGIAGVQVKGFMTVTGSGLSVGVATLAADSAGGVKSAAEGVSATVVSVNEDGTAVICL